MLKMDDKIRGAEVAAPRPGERAKHTWDVGLFAGLAAYLGWGFLPVYFKAVAVAPPLEVLAHRILWAAVLLSTLLMLPGRRLAAQACLGHSGVWRLLAVSTALLAANWLTFIWAVNTGQITQTSLGYFITPFVNVLLGVFFLN